MVIKRVATDDLMEFGEWELDNDIFVGMSEEGEVQDLVPMRQARVTPAEQPLQENEVGNLGTSEEGDPPPLVTHKR